MQKSVVGETKRKAIIRWKEHNRDVKNKKDTPISKHFNIPSHTFEKAKFEIIDIITGNPDCRKVETTRLKQETFWIINLLKTLNPLGINARLGRPISI